MMNFMGSGNQRGFYDNSRMDTEGKHPFSYSSSSSSSSWQKSFVPLKHHQENPRSCGSWLVNNQGESSTVIRSTDERGATAQLEFMMMDSSTQNNSTTGGGGGDEDDTAPAAPSVTAVDDDDQTDDHIHGVRTGKDSSDALGGVSVGGSNNMVVEREHMFDKVVTPSDVGKLNRLVIPKQHAERYFPLDSSNNEKGLLLNFEDRNGKAWRFRYSYWNSSQSYVMTKGWSRFVKEKKLDAGDVVSFQRGVGESYRDRLFIDWRRRPDASELAPPLHHIPFPHHFPYNRPFHPWNPLYLHPQGAVVPPFSGPPRDHQTLMLHQNSAAFQSHQNNYHGASPFGCNYSSLLNPCSGSVLYLRSATAAAAAAAPQQVGMVQVQRRGDGSGVEPMVFDSVPVVHGKAAAKRLRLFGVNMDCPISESDECDVLSSTVSHHPAVELQPPQLSSSITSLQLRPYSGTPLQALSSDFLKKSNSSMPSDLDI